MTMRNIPRVIIGLVSVILVCNLSSCGSGSSVAKERRERERALQREYVDDARLSGRRKALLEEAITWLGTPYKYAGQEKGVCTDCSGFVMQVYQKVLDIKLPRNSAKQADFCQQLRAKDIKPGDLVFFATGRDPDRVSHVGIMLDGISFIHASSSKGVVVSRMDNRWYAQRFKKYGRVPGLK